MTLQRSIAGTAALAGVLLLGAAAGAAAQERQLFEWRGRVDREVRLVMRGRSLDARFAGWNEGGRDRTQVFSIMPREEGYVTLRVQHGRGDVDVIEQPTRGNDYTAVIRIRDPRSRDAEYQLRAFWRPAGGGLGGLRWPWDRADDRRDGDRRGAGAGIPDPGRDGGWASAGGSGVVHWIGRVDDEAEVRIQGGRVETSNIRGDGTRDVRADLSGELPRRDVSVRVDDREGRGRVTVIQQPSAWNGYMAIIRVRDPQSGYGRYSFDVSW
jgi:hypothetical protein